MRLVLLYSFCGYSCIEISVGEENKKGEEGGQERIGGKMRRDERRIMLQSASPDIILEERVIFPKPVDQFSPVCWLERLHTIRILSGQRTHSHDKPTSLSLSSNIYRLEEKLSERVRGWLLLSVYPS